MTTLDARRRVFLAAAALLIVTVLAATPGAAYPERTAFDREWAASGAGDFVLADLTGDGWTDVAAVDGVTGSVWLYRGTSAGLAPEPRILPHTGRVADLEAADIDGNGQEDLLAVGDALSWFSWVAGEVHGASARSNAAGRGLATGDFNGDGFLDLAILEKTGARVWFQRREGPRFEENATLPVAGDGSFDAIVAGDLDGDGRDDLVLGRPYEVRLYLRDGVGLRLNPVRASTNAGGSISLALLETAGDVTLLAVGSAADATGEGAVSLWRWERDRLRLVTTVEAPYAVRVATGDVNDDRRPDLAVVRGDGNTDLFFQRGPVLVFAVPDLRLTGPAAGADARVGIGDVNGDGFDDVVVRSRSPDRILAYLQEDALPRLVRPIPSTYAVNRATYGKAVIDLRQFFADDHHRLTFQVVFASAPDRLAVAVDGGALDFEAADWAGTADFRVSAWDGNPSHPPVESNMFTVLVNEPPALVSMPPVRAVAGEPFAYLVSVTDAYPERDIHAFTLVEGPEGMTIDPATGLVRWTPEATQVGAHAVAIEVRDGHGGLAVQRFSLVVTPVNHDSPLLLVAVGIVATSAALLAAAALLNENAKFAFLLFILPLYSKIKRERVLDHFVRGQIYGYIQANPGEHYNAIKGVLGLTNGSLAHHIRTLEREQFIRSKRFGLYRRFYPMNMRLPDEDAFRPNDIQHRILDAVRDRPGITQKEIASRLGLTPPTVNYHIALLSGRNLVRVERRGRSTHCTIVEDGAT